MSPGWIDANVILRYILNDHREHSPRARDLFRAAENGEYQLKIAAHTVAEVVYVLEGHGFEREKIEEALKKLSQIPNVDFDRRKVILGALISYHRQNVDFADALLAMEANQSDEPVWSFDRDHFRRVNVTWREP